MIDRLVGGDCRIQGGCRGGRGLTSSLGLGQVQLMLVAALYFSSKGQLNRRMMAEKKGQRRASPQPSCVEKPTCVVQGMAAASIILGCIVPMSTPHAKQSIHRYRQRDAIRSDHATAPKPAGRP